MFKISEGEPWTYHCAGHRIRLKYLSGAVNTSHQKRAPLCPKNCIKRDFTVAWHTNKRGCPSFWLHCERDPSGMLLGKAQYIKDIKGINFLNVTGFFLVFYKYTVSHLQRVWLQRTPSSYEQITLHQNHWVPFILHLFIIRCQWVGPSVYRIIKVEGNAVFQFYWTLYTEPPNTNLFFTMYTGWVRCPLLNNCSWSAEFFGMLL